MYLAICLMYSVSSSTFITVSAEYLQKSPLLLNDVFVGSLDIIIGLFETFTFSYNSLKFYYLFFFEIEFNI